MPLNIKHVLFCSFLPSFMYTTITKHTTTTTTTQTTVKIYTTVTTNITATTYTTVTTQITALFDTIKGLSNIENTFHFIDELF